MPLLPSDDKTVEKGTVLHAQIENRGKLARNLEANIHIKNMTDGLERVYWSAPSGKTLTFPRISKLDKASLQIAYMSPRDKLWKINTPFTESKKTVYTVRPNYEYRVVILVYYEPSDTKGWQFKLTIDSRDGELYWHNLRKCKT